MKGFYNALLSELEIIQYCRFGVSALMAASSNGHLQTVQKLIKAGANLGARCEVTYMIIDQKSQLVVTGELRGPGWR